MIDNVSVVNILYAYAYHKMGLTESDIKPVTIPLYNSLETFSCLKEKLCSIVPSENILALLLS